MFKKKFIEVELEFLSFDEDVILAASGGNHGYDDLNGTYDDAWANW